MDLVENKAAVEVEDAVAAVAVVVEACFDFVSQGHESELETLVASVDTAELEMAEVEAVIARSAPETVAGIVEIVVLAGNLVLFAENGGLVHCFQVFDSESVHAALILSREASA